MKRVLLTGATGFIGRQVLRPLVEGGYEVHAVAREVPQSAQRGSGVNWHAASVLDAAQTHALVSAIQPTHLLHLAWYVEHGKFWHAPENEHWRTATQNLYAQFAANGGQRAVLAGTCAEYEWGLGDGVCDEATTPTKPNTLYGASKLALLEDCMTVAQQQDQSFAWGRIFFPYGAGEPSQKLVSSVIRSLLKDEVAKTSSGEQVRDLIYARDVAEAFVALLSSDVRGAVNIGTGEGVTLKDVVMEIAQQLDRVNWVRLGAVPTNPNDPPVLVAKVTRLRAEVGWQPKVDLASGVAEAIAWWKGVKTR